VSDYTAAGFEPLRLDRLSAHVWWRLGSLANTVMMAEVFLMADRSGQSGWLGVRLTSLMLQPSQTTRDRNRNARTYRCLYCGVRAYRNPGDPVDGVNMLRAS